MGNVSQKFVEKVKTHIFCSIVFFSKRRALYEIIWKKYDRARQATNGNVMRRMRFACWMSKAADTQNGFANAPQC
jgi:hypothetical protein